MDRVYRPSIRDSFEFGLEIFKNNFGLFTAWMLTFFASWVILEVIVVAGQQFGFLWWLAAHLSFFVVFAGLEVGFIQICLDLYDGRQVIYSDIFHDINLGVGFLIVQLTYLASLLVGLVLLIIPGVYISTRYSFYAYHFVEEKLSLKYSFQRSAETSQGSMRFLFWFSVTPLLFNLLGASFLGVGLFATIPLSSLMKAHVFQKLKAFSTNHAHGKRSR